MTGVHVWEPTLAGTMTFSGMWKVLWENHGKGERIITIYSILYTVIHKYNIFGIFRK